jgi:hypothetical protein
MDNVIKHMIREFVLASTGFSRLIPALVLLGALAGSPASATTYTFILSTGTQGSPNPNTILGALSAANSGDPFSPDPGLFAFYDFYIRPETEGDNTNGQSNHPSPFNVITDYSISASTATAPVPGCAPTPCTPTYESKPIAEPFPGLVTAANLTFNPFTFNPGDIAIALVTVNPGAGNQNYDRQSTSPAGAPTEIKPPAEVLAFRLDTSAYSAFQTPHIIFQVLSLAVRH